MGWTHEQLAEALSRGGCRISRDSLTASKPKSRVAIETGPTPKSQPQPLKRKKYGNVPVERGEIKYDSGKEMRRHQELLILEREGSISDLQLKPKYVFEHNGVRITTFRPDFAYVEDGRLIIEDVKGVDRRTGKKPTSTEPYRIRKKLLKAFFGLSVRET